MDLPVIEAEPTAALPTVRPDECLACYLDRTIPQLGCRSLALTARWNAAQATPVVNLLDRLRSRGGFCDCEVVVNVLDYGQPYVWAERLQCDESRVG